MAGNGTLIDKGFTIKTRKLRGETLVEVEKECERSGMTDPNDRSKKFFSVTDVKIELEIGDEAWYPGGMNILGFKIHMYPQLLNPEVTVTSTITVCEPAKLGKLSSAAKSEWKRFYAALLKHEKQHVADGKKLAEQMLKELAALSVHLIVEDLNENRVRREALKLLGKEATKTFGSGEIAKRINAAMKKLDSGGHGGVILKSSIV